MMPDLAFLISMYRQQEPGQAPLDGDTLLINKFVRARGHEFVYDEKILGYAMWEAGFDGIVHRRLLESEHEEFGDLEHVDRKPPGHLNLESMVLEATKPSRG